MAFCSRCGAALPEQARFCPQCGAAAQGAPPVPPPAPLPGVPAAKPKPDTHLAEMLLLVGAALSLVVPLLLAVVILAIGSTIATVAPFWGAVPGALFALLALVLLLLGAIWGAAAWYARGRIQQGDLEGGGMIAMIVGLLMFVTGHFIAGPLVAVGGVMAWSQK